MSIDVLKKTISLIESEDGIDAGDVKRQRKKHLSLMSRERQRLKATVENADFNEESGEIVFPKRNVKRRRTTLFPVEQCSQDESLIEQYRKLKKKDIRKRTINYMKYTEKRKLEPSKCDRLLSLIAEPEIARRQFLKELSEQNSGLREPNPFKKKVESGSVFSEEDFANVGVGRLRAPSRKMQQL
ncbi:hypothetical protein AB6A40_003397 [Gnathostoma spinigerum]|uniref:Ribosome biogenesis protein NOP53 n=1 Tax=Gnathostoma spinigerum TaxID=75299 RepID=A0ABD6E9F9_9BILA